MSSNGGANDAPLPSLRSRLEEAEQTIEAIRNGQVDAVVVEGVRGPQVYNLEGPDTPFRVFVERMQQGALSLSCDDTILYCNAAFAELVKMPLEQVMGRRLVDFLDGDAEDRARVLIDSCLVAPLSAEIVLRAHGGERIPAFLAMAPLSGAEPPTCCVTVSDLRMHERIREARVAQEAAEAANTAKDQFLAILSHELRTPLNTILGWAQILQRLELGEEARKGIESIERNAHAQAKLISDLLDTTGIAAGKLRLELRSVPIDEVVESAVASVSTTAAAQGLRISTLLGAEPATVSGDRGRLQQILTNILTNAVKYTEHEGGEIQVSTRRSGAGIEIEVSDNGQGISPEFLPRLFGFFEQEETAATRRAGGLGLGLAIVKQLVELHEGTVRAESDGHGKGSKFTVWLPLSAAETEAPSRAAGAESSETRASIDLRGIRVLVVDDDSDARDLLRQMFAEGGADVIVGSGADEAADLVERERPDVLVSDVAMPRRDGYDLLRDLRTRGFRLPAIALSAFARKEDRDRAFGAGFQAHFAKPIDAQKVAATIAALVRRQSA
jgi:signal transduction histidine kinase/ActR/RegA family two-component response regulator